MSHGSISDPSVVAENGCSDIEGGPRGAGIKTNASPPRGEPLHTERNVPGGGLSLSAATRNGAQHCGVRASIAEHADPDPGGGDAGAQQCQERHSSSLGFLPIRGRDATPGAGAQRGGQAVAARSSLEIRDSAPAEGPIRGRDTAPGGCGEAEAEDGGGSMALLHRDAARAESRTNVKRERCGAEGHRMTASQRLSALRQRVALRGAASAPAGGGGTGGGSHDDHARGLRGILDGADAVALVDDVPRRGGAAAADSSPARQVKTEKCTLPPAGAANSCMVADGEVVADCFRVQAPSWTRSERMRTGARPPEEA